MMKTVSRFITSRHNPLIKEAMRIKDRKERGLLLIDGEHCLEMAHASGIRIKRIFFSKGYRNLRFLRELSKEAELIETTGGIISILSDTVSPQGVVGIAEYRTSDIDNIQRRDAPVLMVCDRIGDPGNLGTMIRTADAAGIDAVIILPGTCDPFMQKVIRASAGSIFNIPLVFTSIDYLLKWLKERRLHLIVTSLKAEKTIFETDLTKGVALVFGNEAMGVSSELIAAADEIVRIPIIGKAESLNVATAASICLYESLRQLLSHRR